MIEEWLDNWETIPMLDGASVSLARERVREVGARAGLGADTVEPLVLVVSELARNQIAHAIGGRIGVRIVERADARGLEIIAADRGQGLVNPTHALEGRPRPAGSLGIGLAAARDMAHELDFDIRIGEGTCVWARRFAGELAPARQVGIYGRPKGGEARSGDGACFARRDGALVVGVCDGLGHGEPAHEASVAAMQTFTSAIARSPADIITACHGALAKTRGAVMAVAVVDDAVGSMDLSSVGNVATHVYGVRTGRRFGGSSFVVGAPQRAWRVYTEAAPIAARETLVMFTDGITSRVALEDDFDLLREHPIVIAHQVLEKFVRDGDDALVLVAR